jgi:signal transduction histidine kinase
LELTDLNSLLNLIALQYGDRSPDRRITTNLDEPAEVLADVELLSLALSQLVENACKYSEPGSTVGIRIQCKRDFVAVHVSNDGSSIPPNEHHLVFERFYRGVDARRSTSGSGLGLYVARKIALAHGGALELDTGGATDYRVTFCLKLPSAQKEVQDDIHHAVTRVAAQ